MKVALVTAFVVTILSFSLPADARFESSSASEPALRITDIQLFTSDGPIDAVPAETAVGVRVSVRNGTSHVARNVRLELNPPAGITMPYPNAAYGTIAVGEVRSKAIGFEISAEQCNAPVLHIFGTLRSADQANPIVVDVNTDCPGPRFFVSAIRFRGGNGDAIADPGERLAVFIKLQNEGHDVARDVRGTLDVRNGDLDVIDSTASWPDIAPGETAENKQPFIIQLSLDAPRREVCGTPIVGVPGKSPAAPPPSSTKSAAPSAQGSPAPSAAVGFDAIVHVQTDGRTLNASFSSGYPCFSETGAAEVRTNDAPPVPAPSSRIPYFLIVVGIGVAAAIFVRARLNRQ